MEKCMDDCFSERENECAGSAWLKFGEEIYSFSR